MRDDRSFKVLFDGDCPLCRREIATLKRLDRHDRIETEDIAALGFDPGRYGLTQDEVMGTIHGITPDGQVVQGMEVFRRLYKAVGLGWALSWTEWPVARPAVDAGYRWFARNRLRLTGRGSEASCQTDRCARV